MNNPPSDDFNPYLPHMVFTLDMNEDEASAIFVKRHKRPPNNCEEHNHQLWVGPIPPPSALPESEEK